MQGQVLLANKDPTNPSSIGSDMGNSGVMLGGLREDSAPFREEEDLAPLRAKGVLALLSIEEVEGVIPVPNKASIF